jgi:amino acid adenylation domain-containing protein
MTDLSKRIEELSPEKRELLLRRLDKETGDVSKAQAKTKLPSVVSAPAERHKPFPLTDIQQAYWIGRGGSFELGGVACHIYREIESQDLDVEQLQLALRRLIDRHEMLRTIILSDGQQQILEQIPPYEITVLDLRGQDPRQAAARLEAVRSEMSHQVLPSDRAPMFEFRASLIDNQRIRIHLSLDVLVTDARSINILFEELHQVYENPEVFLHPLDLSFRDYVLTAATLKDSETYRRSRDYWLSRLSTMPPAPDLPLAKSPSSVKDVKFTRRSARLEAECWSRLKARGGRAGLTPSGVLLAAYAEVLGAWSKNLRFAINLTLFNRLPLHPQVNEVIGDFTSVTMLEVDNAAQPTFQERARHLQRQLWADMDHRSFGGVQVLRELARKQGGGHGASMPVVFTSLLPDETDVESTNPISWMGNTVYESTQTPQVWLDHMAAEEAGVLVTKWDVVEELFPPGLLDDMFDAYCRLLRRLADEEESWQESRPTMVLKLVPPAQIRLRRAINATEGPISEGLLHSFFFDQAIQRPNQVAVITPKRTLSYGELQSRASQAAHWLRQRGAQPNSLVAVVMEKGWEQVVGALGVLASGAAYLPIDATLPRERLAYLLEHGQVSLALTQSWHDQKIEWPSGIQRLCVDQVDQLGLSTSFLEPVQRSEDLAYVIYTSGSTGLPKGVVIDHRGAVNTILDVNQRFQVRPEDRVLALSALNFDLSVYDVFGVLAAGGTIVVPEAFSERNPAHWAELIAEHRVTIWDTVPALMHMLVEYLGGRSEKLPDSLRLVMMSGDWIPVDLPDRIKAMSSDIEVVSLGGATEASIWSILYPIERVEPSWTSIPYGRPMVNQSLHVLNDVLAPCPVWVPGQLYIGGIGLAKGYWRDEEKTRVSFITHPRTGQRLYRTGDLGRYLPDGNIEFIGREDFQVKIRGHRIELGEIETVMLQHQGVHATVVAAIGEARGNKRLVAYVVPAKKPVSGSPENRNASKTDLAPDDRVKGSANVLVDPVERLKFKLGNPGLREDNEKPSVQLVKLKYDDGLVSKYLTRRSYRKYANTPIPFEKFSAFLSCLFQIKIDGVPFPKYRYASAGSLYPVQTYLYVKPNRVEGLAAGTYYHHPVTHRLIVLTPDAEIHRGHFPYSQAIFDESAFALFLIGQYEAISPMYGDLTRDFCMIETGLICQLLESTAPEQQIGLCQIGGLNFSPIRHLFSLGTNYEYLHCLLGGPVGDHETSLEAFSKGFDDFRPLLNFGDVEIANTNQAASERTTSLSAPPVSSHQKGEGQFIEELKSFIKDKLPEYMVPASFVLLNSLPLSPNGKVDRKALPKPEMGTDSDKEYVAPRTDIERIIADVWKEVLKQEQVGIYDDFFELGGNSILATRVISQINRYLSMQLPLRRLFEARTVESLAEVVCTFSASSSNAEIMNSQKKKADPRDVIKLIG